jgi:hypothetical protein
MQQNPRLRVDVVNQLVRVNPLEILTLISKLQCFLTFLRFFSRTPESGTIPSRSTSRSRFTNASQIPSPTKISTRSPNYPLSPTHFKSQLDLPRTATNHLCSPLPIKTLPPFCAL